jgi:hypothetical protein
VSWPLRDGISFTRDILKRMIDHVKTAPIGVFDSGIGGLTVFRALFAELPVEHSVDITARFKAAEGSMSAKSLILAGALASSYALVIVPVGLLLRLLRIDPLRRRRNAQAHSYWVLRDGAPVGKASFLRQI